jgi:hypothetical protein
LLTNQCFDIYPIESIKNKDTFFIKILSEISQDIFYILYFSIPVILFYRLFSFNIVWIIILVLVNNFVCGEPSAEVKKDSDLNKKSGFLIILFALPADIIKFIFTNSIYFVTISFSYVL